MLLRKIIVGVDKDEQDNVDKVGDQDLLLLLSWHINALLTLLLGANLQPHFIFRVSVYEKLLNYLISLSFFS